MSCEHYTVTEQYKVSVSLLSFLNSCFSFHFTFICCNFTLVSTVFLGPEKLSNKDRFQLNPGSILKFYLINCKADNIKCKIYFFTLYRTDISNNETYE